MFSFHITLEQFIHVIIPGHFRTVFLFEENLVRENHGHHLRKASFQNLFRPHERSVFSISSGLKSAGKSVIEKLCFRNKLVWTVGPVQP